ncbi:MAG: lyase domain protein repeat-containing protein [Myxococcales bacterium]|nr:lyase domain protein repeat-containing protein [Myxococcales bacterium]
MKNINKFAAVAFAFVASITASVTPALAGKDGSNAKIVSAVRSGSVDAIVAEVERAEALMCEECIQTITNLTEDNRFAVREVAAWWFAKRPQMRELMASQMIDDLGTGDSFHVRNAADFLGGVREYTALPALRTTITRSGLSSEAKLAIVRAVGFMAHLSGNSILQTAMGDADATVRAAAIVAWRDVLGQMSVTPIESRLGDSDAGVRAEAATVLGAYGDANVAATLEQLVVSDPDAFVRRNAAWALGKIGQASSRDALTKASEDKSGLVKLVAKAALSSLH